MRKALFCIALAFLMFPGCKGRNPTDSEPDIPRGMKLIQGGTFQMGDTLHYGAQPVHSVTVSSFYMDTTEVTQADYLALMGVYPRHCLCDSGSTWPVNSVSWLQAVLYCNARSKRDGLDTVYSYDSIIAFVNPPSIADLIGLSIDFTKNGYRLPTEAEWEYACRAGTTTDYYWGRDYPPVTRDDTLAIENNVVLGEFQYYPARVATKLPNAWGLYDMIGNVYEWCNDWSGAYSSGSQTDPTGPLNGSTRIMRGGEWFNTDPFYLCSALRDGALPFDEGNPLQPGFRCVRQ
jgi:formylglycine-generating enzyme